MKSTVGRQLSTRPVEKDDFVSWASREASPLLKALKAFADSRYSTHFKATTANTGVLTQIWQEDMPQDSAWAIDAHVVGHVSALPGRIRKSLSGLFFRVGSGAAQLEGVTTVVSIDSTGSMNAQLSISGNGVQLQVSDGGNGNTSWDAVIVIQEAP